MKHNNQRKSPTFLLCLGTLVTRLSHNNFWDLGEIDEAAFNARNLAALEKVGHPLPGLVPGEAQGILEGQEDADPPHSKSQHITL